MKKLFIIIGLALAGVINSQAAVVDMNYTGLSGPWKIATTVSTNEWRQLAAIGVQNRDAALAFIATVPTNTPEEKTEHWKMYGAVQTVASGNASNAVSHLPATMGSATKAATAIRLWSISGNAAGFENYCTNVLANGSDMEKAIVAVAWCQYLNQSDRKAEASAVAAKVFREATKLDEGVDYSYLFRQIYPNTPDKQTYRAMLTNIVNVVSPDNIPGARVVGAASAKLEVMR